MGAGFRLVAVAMLGVNGGRIYHREASWRVGAVCGARGGLVEFGSPHKRSVHF